MRNLQVGSTRLLLAFFVVLGASMMTGCGGDETTTAPPTDASDATDSTDSTDSTDQTDGTDSGTEDATTGDDSTDGTSASDDADSTDQADTTDDAGATSSSDGADDVDVTDGLDAGPGDATDSSDATDDVVETGCPGDCPLEANCEFCPLYESETQIVCQDGPSATQACVDAMLASESEFPQGSGGQIAFPSCIQAVCANNGGAPRCELAAISNCASSGDDCPANSPCFTYAFTQVSDEEKPAYLADTQVGVCVQTTQFANPACCNGITNTTVGDSSFNDTFPSGWSVIGPTPDDPVSWHLIDEALAPPQFSGRCLSGGGCMHFGYKKGGADNCLTYFNGDITI